jgi:pectate lyase
MNCDKDVTAVFITEFDSSYEFENTPIGFASVEALGQNGTSGGQGGDTTIVETGEDLFQILDDRRDPRFERNLQPLVLLVEGSLTWTDEAMMDLKENYDLSIIGNGGNARIIGFGLNIFRSYNIIIRNLEFRDAPDDCINVTDSLSHHIWIDHCTFSDSPDVDPNGDRHDGLLDIKHGASYITVSWNHFYNHQKTALLGHSDGNAEEDVDHLKVTYHHNWWDNTGSRHPRVRFGEVHVYNNYYDNTQQKMGYGIASTMEADVVAEANYFKMVPYPTHVGYGDSEEGDLLEFNNIYENSGTPEVRGTAFNPTAYYTYLVDDPMSLPALLMAYCGSGKLDSVSDEIDDVPRSYPAGFELSQNYPNPFNQTTRISFTLPEGGLLRLIIFDMAGKEVTQLVNETKNAGRHSVLFDASELSSGVYFYQIQSRGQLITRKMMLLK